MAGETQYILLFLFRRDCDCRQYYHLVPGKQRTGAVLYSNVVVIGVVFSIADMSTVRSLVPLS